VLLAVALAGCEKGQQPAAGPTRTASLKDEQGINLKTGQTVTVGSEWLAKKELLPKIDLGLSDFAFVASPKGVGNELQFGRLAHLGKVSFPNVRPPRNAAKEPIYFYSFAKELEDVVGHVFCVECQDGTWARVRITGVSEKDEAFAIEWQLFRTP